MVDGNIALRIHGQPGQGIYKLILHEATSLNIYLSKLAVLSVRTTCYRWATGFHVKR